ncbi:MAG TPA: hypothetical protein VNI52_12200 [Sphingobacteriaceae bacterium]|nr:hypothetical protein [Sphingobacteriaceae bacterium]
MIVFSILLMECTQKVKFNRPPDEVVDTSIINSTLIPPYTIDRNFTVFKGLYISGNDVSTFRDCKTGKIYWITDSSGKMTKMYSDIGRYPAYPYESVYAEITGYLKGKSKRGLASKYENELIVKSIEKLEGKSFNTGCYPYEFIALGNEPFWSVDIIPAENRIVLKDVGTDKAYEFPYKKAIVTGDIHKYEVSNSKNDKLTLIIRKQNCNDGMSEREYFYAASLTINGRSLKGCAIRKGDQLKGNP